MKNNTIEIRLTSYGTLEVVSIPVKLYRDSYNIVKLRVLAPFVVNSMLKVYASDYDDAGERVWTSATYSLDESKEIKVIDGQTYTIYEKYFPQEFCTKDELNLTFAQVVLGDDGVEKILTSGTLNLVIGGEGFNYNGTNISKYDEVSVKINNLLANRVYDLVIKTQEQFDEFCNSLANKTCTATSVLFVGDGGGLTFTKVFGREEERLVLPATLRRLDGINKATIRLEAPNPSTYYTLLQYESKNNDGDYSVSGISFVFLENGLCKGFGGFENISDCSFEMIGDVYSHESSFEEAILYNCKNISNCKIVSNKNIYGQYATSRHIGLLNCENVYNCKFENVNNASCNYISDCIGTSTLFSTCNKVINVESDGNNVVAVFTRCNNLVNCISNATSIYGFYGCDYLTNCIGGSFSKCNYLSNCDGNFGTCNYLSNCVGEINNNTCTNVWATKDDVKESLSDANITSEKLLDVIEDSQSIIASTNSDGTKVTFNLDAEITNQISKSLVLPMSAPASTKIVAVDDGNSQTMLGLGDGLSLQNGTLVATGKGVDVVQTTGSSTSAVMSQNAVTNQINTLSQKIDNIGQTGSSVTVVDTLVSQSTSDALSARQGNVLYNMITDTGKEINQNELNAQKHIFIGGNGVLQGNVYNFTIQDASSYIAYRTNLTKFLVDLNLAISGDLDKTKEVAITFGDTTYYLFNILKGNQHATIGDLQQVERYSNATGYRFIAEMTFFQTSDLVGFAIIPTISVSDVLSLDSDQMDDYVADGGLSQGQLAICNKVITNGYSAGSLYRFDITYPNTYSWTQLSYSKAEIDTLIGDIETLLSEV